MDQCRYIETQFSSGKQSTCCTAVLLQLRVHFEGKNPGVVSVDLAYHADRGSALDFSEFVRPAYDCDSTHAGAEAANQSLVNVLPEGLETLNLCEDYQQGCKNLLSKVEVR